MRLKLKYFILELIFLFLYICLKIYITVIAVYWTFFYVMLLYDDVVMIALLTLAISSVVLVIVYGLLDKLVELFYT